MTLPKTFVSHVHSETVVEVLVPRAGDTGKPYLDALGATREESMAHFTRYGRYDLTLSEIFHLEFDPARIFFGGATSLRSDLYPVVLPFSKENGVPLVKGVSSTSSDCVALIRMMGGDPYAFEYQSAGLAT